MHGTVKGATPPREYDAEVEALPALFGMSRDALDVEPPKVMGRSA